MNELTTADLAQLPDTLEDLTQFVLVGKAKLQAYMLKLQTVNKLSVAQEIRDQTLKETQEVSNALIAAEQRIGELLLAIPKQTGNQYTSASVQSGTKAKTKDETAAEMGYTHRDVVNYQQMAKHPEVVQRVIDDALSNGEVVTKSQVLKEIKAERDKAKAEADMQLAEKDRRIEALESDSREREDYISTREEYIHELESREPEKIEVPPADYKDLKKKVKEINALKQDYKNEQAKVNEKQKQILELQDRIAELEGATKEGLENESLSENVYYFCMLANNFVGNVGGLVWLTERIGDMPKKERELFLKAAHALEGFSLAFVQNLERSGYCESRSNGNDRRGEIPVITNQKEHGKN